jgi:hypothetical protein
MAHDTTATTRPTLCLNLGATGIHCTLLMDGMDISQYVRGVDVHAHVGDVTEVTITLLANVEILGEAGRLILRKDGTREG